MIPLAANGGSVFPRNTGSTFTRNQQWVVVTATETLFALAASRGRGVIRGLLGEDFAGYLDSDRWSAYVWVDETRRQLCWAHLARAFQALVDRGGTARPFGEDARDLVGGLFAVWHADHADPVRRATLAADTRPIQHALNAVLDRGLDYPVKDVNGLCHDLLMHWPSLWTFVTTPGVAPTNNTAERAIRPAVLWRKGSFGTQSDTGNAFVARMLSVAATCKQHNRSLTSDLTAVCTAAQARQPVPSLLATSA